MMKYGKRNLAAIDIITVLCGIILLLLESLSSNSMITTLIEAIGTSLVVAGFVSFLVRRLYLEDQQDNVKIISESRAYLESEYVRRKYGARRIDIVSIALSNALKELATDPGERMLRRVVFEGAKVRLLFLDPDADYVEHRAIEDGTQLEETREALKKSVRYCTEIHSKLSNIYQKAASSHTLEHERMGSFEIRVMDMCPHFTIYRTDNVILWGLYTSAQRGLYSPVIEVPKEQNTLYEPLMRHFEKLWETGASGLGRNNFIVSFYDPAPPRLNEQLVERILGSQWRDGNP